MGNVVDLSKHRMEQAIQCIKSAKALTAIEDYRGAANAPITRFSMR